MKKQPLLVSISLFLCASLLAQVSVQPLVGGTSSSFDYNNDFEMNQAVQSFDGENKGGFTGGIKVNIPTNDLGWHIAPELFFIQNGSKEFYRRQTGNVFHVDRCGRSRRRTQRPQQ